MNTERERLPNRRAAVTFDFEHVSPSGLRATMTATVGLYPDGRIGEVFLVTAKSGTDLQIANRDAAVALSLAFQHGCPIEAVAPAFLRDPGGRPEGALGTLAEILVSGAWRP